MWFPLTNEYKFFCLSNNDECFTVTDIENTCGNNLSSFRIKQYCNIDPGKQFQGYNTSRCHSLQHNVSMIMLGIILIIIKSIIIILLLLL